MGYYADSEWQIKFHSRESMDACLTELGLDPERFDSDFQFFELFGEDTYEFTRKDVEDEEERLLWLCGGTTGKWFMEADSLVATVAKYADGEVLFNDENNDLWKVVLRDGRVIQYPGIVVYTDRFDEAHVKAQEAKMARDGGDTAAEAAALWEALRVMVGAVRGAAEAL